MENPQESCPHCNRSQGENHHVTTVKESLNQMKQSTRKLLHLLDEIESKTLAKCPNIIKPKCNETEICSEYIADAEFTDIVSQDYDNDNCTVFDRLVGRCNCFMHPHYTDFVIQFTEHTKYKSNVMGEIIKNMKILKKFIYIGGEYTKNGLSFLNEGLSDSIQSEKVKIIEGCAYADICNVFDDDSIVKTMISWPCKNKTQDYDIQALAAALLYKFSMNARGKEYLNLNSKIFEEIRNVINKKSAKLEFETLETLTSTANILRPPAPTAEQTDKTANLSDPYTKGMGSKILAALNCQDRLNVNDVLTHLDILRNISNSVCGRRELKGLLKIVFDLFRDLLKEYDNSEMNILITNILDNIVPRSSMQKTVYLPEKVNVMRYFAKTEKVKTFTESKITKLNRISHRKKENKDSIIVVPIEIENIS